MEGDLRPTDEQKSAAPPSRRGASPINKFSKVLPGGPVSTEPNRSKRGNSLNAAVLRKSRGVVRSSSPRLTDRMLSTSPELIMEIDGDLSKRHPVAAASSLPAVSQTPLMYVDAEAVRAALFPQPTKSPTQLRPGSIGQSSSSG